MSQNWWESAPVVEQAPQPVFTAPDPNASLDRRRDEIGIARTEQQIQRDAATSDADARKASADAALAEMKVSQERAKMSKLNTDARGELERLIGKIDEIAADASDNGGWFETGYTGSALRRIPGTAAYGLKTKLDTLDANQAFRALQQMRESSPTGGALGQITERELDLLKSTIANLDPNQSQQDFLQSLDEARSYYQGLIDKLPAEQQAEPQLQNAMTRIRMGNRDDALVAAGFGETEKATPYPPELVTAHDEMVARLLSENGGRLDPQAYASEKARLLAQNGYQTASSDADVAWASSLNEYLQAGGKTVPSGLMPATEQMGTAEMLQNSAANNPLGAYFGGAANALTGGTIDEIAGAVGGEEAGQQAQWAKDQLRNDYPVSSVAGEISGAALGMVPATRAAQMVGRGALAGDVAYGAAYGAGENNDNRLTGAVVGAGGAYAGNKIGGALLEKFRSRIPAEAGKEAVAETADNIPMSPAQKLERAKRYGIDLSVGDVRGMGAKATERVLDAQPGGAGVMNKARQQTLGQVEGAVNDVAGGYGTAGTTESMGNALQRGARAWIEKAKGRPDNPLDRGVIGKAYDAIPIPPNTPAQLDNTLSALEDLNSQFSSNPKLAAMMQDTRTSKMLDALGDVMESPENSMSGVRRTLGVNDNTPVGISWSDMKALRSAIGEDMGAGRLASDNSRRSNLSRLYAALSEDMKATAAAQGPRAAASFERANNLNRQVEQRIEGALTSLLGRSGDMNPEAAATKLRAMTTSGKSTSDLRQLIEIRKSIPNEEWGDVAGALIRLAGQPAKSEGRAFDPSVFVRTFADMSEGAKNVLFGGQGKELRRNLDEFVSVMGDIAGSNATRNTSNTGMAISGGLGLMTGGVPALVAQTLGSYGAARLWTSPKFVKWATGYQKMLNGAARNGAQPSAANIEKQIGLLDSLAKGQGPISADIIVFRDYLQNSLARAPERAAAEPTQEDRP